MTRHDGDEVRVHDRQRRAADPVEDRCDESAMPLREREERGTADRRARPRRDHQWPPSEAIGGETQWDERERRDDVAKTDDEADVGRRRAEVLQKQGQQRAEESEARAPQELGTEQRADVATYRTTTFVRPLTTPALRRSSNSSRAALSTAASASTSIAVSASAFAATSARSR